MNPGPSPPGPPPVPGGEPASEPRPAPRRSLRRRLFALGLAPVVLAFPIVLGVITWYGLARTERLLVENARTHLVGVRAYLDQARTRITQDLRGIVRSGRLTAMYAGSLREPNGLDGILAHRAQVDGLDFLVLVTEDGSIVASAVRGPAGASLVPGSVLRRAAAGSWAGAYEVLDARTLAAVTPGQEGAQGRARPARRELAMTGAVHLPFSPRHPDAVLYGGVLLGESTAAVDRIRDIVFPVDEGGHGAGATAIYLGSQARATNVMVNGERASGQPAPPEVAEAVLGEGRRVVDHFTVSGTRYIGGFEPLVDADGRRIGMLFAGFPDSGFTRERWLVLAGVAVVLAGAMLALSWVFLATTGDATGRLSRIAGAMAAFRRGERGVRVGGQAGEDEIGQLGRGLDRLLEDLEANDRSRAEAQAALQRSEESLLRAQALAAMGSGHLDFATGAWECSAETRRMLHLPREGLVEFAEVLARVHPEDAARVQAVWRDALRGGEYEIEHRVVVEGRTRWLHVRVAFERDAHGRAVACTGTAQDITERKRIEDELDRHRHHLEDLVSTRTRELARARDDAESANRARDAFLANIGHEIRTPLNVIIGYATLLGRESADFVSRERAARIERSAWHLLRVFNDILDLARLESRNMELRPEDFSIASLLERAREGSEAAAREKGLAWQVTVDPDVPPVARGDAGHLGRILAHLVDNAVKFSERGRIAVRVRLVDAGAESLHLRFEVADEGRGIDEAERTGAFKRFEQPDASTTRRFGGMGLGLPISRRLAQLMGGDLGLAGAPGGGTLAWFTVRVERTAAALPPPATPDRAPGPATGEAPPAPDPGEAAAALDALETLLAHSDHAAAARSREALAALSAALGPRLADYQRAIRDFDFESALALLRAARGRAA